MRDAIGRRLCLLGTAVILLAAALPALAQKERKGEKKPPEKEPPAGLEKVTPVGKPLAHDRWVRGTAFTADGKLLITAGADHVLRVWDVRNGDPVGPPMKAPHSINGLALSPDGTTALVGCGNADNTAGEAQLWDVAAGKLLATLETEGPVWGVAVSENGKLLTGTYQPPRKMSTAQLWEWDENQPQMAPRLLRDMPHDSTIWAVALSPDGKTAATGSTDHKLRLFETDGGKLVGEPPPLPDDIGCVGFAPGGKRVLAACGGARKGGEVHVWSVADKKPLGRILYKDDIQAAMFSPNHKYILTGDADRTARLWDATRDSPVCERISCPVEVLTVAYSPDGQYIAVGGAVDNTPTGHGAAQLYRLTAKLSDARVRRPRPVRGAGIK
jgi:WD40 repeat protein